MKCPNGWICSEDCAHYLGIDQCDYVEEEVSIQEIADKIEKQVSVEAKKDAEVIKSKHEELDEHEKFWRDWARTSPPDSLKQREPINAMSGSINFGGGGSVKRKKSKKGNKPTVYVWGETS